MTLSPRELEVLALVGQGYTNVAIAKRLMVEPRTVERHVGAILEKVGFGGMNGSSEFNPRVMLARLADRLCAEGLNHPPPVV